MVDPQVVKAWLASKQGSDSGEAIQPKVLVLAGALMELEATVKAYQTRLDELESLVATPPEPEKKKTKE